MKSRDTGSRQINNNSRTIRLDMHYRRGETQATDRQITDGNQTDGDMYLERSVEKQTADRQIAD
jgi:hypothetical protein